MMLSQTTIMMLIMLFMLVMFIWGKFSYGLIAMTCCTLAVITGVCDVQTAFAGLSNKMTILIATMFVIGHAFSKTSFTKKIQNAIIKASNKSGTGLVFTVLLIMILMVQYMVSGPAITIIISFLVVLGNKGEVTTSKILLPLAMITGAWYNLLPIGNGAVTFATANALMGLKDPETMLGVFDIVKVGIVPALLMLAYCLLIWRRIPETEINKDKVGTVKETESAYTKRQELVVYIIFAAVIACFILSSTKLGKKMPNLMYIAPVVGTLILVFGKLLSTKETVAVLTSPLNWMIAGVVAIGDIISSSGAGNVIGGWVLGLLQNTTNGFVICLLFGAITIIMTTFISNTGTILVMAPIAASVAAAGGMDPRALGITVTLCCMCSFAFPTGSNAAMLVYAAGQYNPAKVAKITVPAMIMEVVTVAFFAGRFFPVY